MEDNDVPVYLSYDIAVYELTEQQIRALAHNVLHSPVYVHRDTRLVAAQVGTVTIEGARFLLRLDFLDDTLRTNINQPSFIERHYECLDPIEFLVQVPH